MKPAVVKRYRLKVRITSSYFEKWSVLNRQNAAPHL
jgi:hypothetical protein